VEALQPFIAALDCGVEPIWTPDMFGWSVWAQKGYISNADLGNIYDYDEGVIDEYCRKFISWKS